jgi:hypothetical protein
MYYLLFQLFLWLCPQIGDMLLAIALELVIRYFVIGW